MPSITRGLRCSFCGKRADEVAKLVAGALVSFKGRAYICDECVAIASRIMAAGDPAAGDPAVAQQHSPATTV